MIKALILKLKEQARKQLCKFKVKLQNDSTIKLRFTSKFNSKSNISTDEIFIFLKFKMGHRFRSNHIREFK